jgi:hypothetical protein
MSSSPPTGGLPEIDWAAVVARSDRKQAALASLTPQEAAGRERYYRELGRQYLRTTIRKRKRGHRDCRRELAAAERHAAAAVSTHPANGTPASQVPARAVRARERRAGSSSRTAGTDPGDGGDCEPAGEQLALTGPQHLAAELARIAARLRARGGVG